MSSYKILFPTDFSPASYAALDVAASLARDRDATLIVAHCEETPLGFGGRELPLSKDVDDDLQAMLSEVLGGMKGIPYEKRLLRGDPGRTIVKLADKEDVNLIVLGTHGRTGLKRVLMGSVAEAVIRNSTCPVLTIRQAA